MLLIVYVFRVGRWLICGIGGCFVKKSLNDFLIFTDRNLNGCLVGNGAFRKEWFWIWVE
mgnify:CR=1 FL=1